MAYTIVKSQILRFSAYFFLLLFVSMSISSCIEIKHKVGALIPGEYRGVFLLGKDPYKYYGEDSPARQKTIFTGISENEIPFNFTIAYANDEPYIILKNASQELKITDISLGTDRNTSHDTVRIRFKEYNSYIFAEFAEGVMQGFYRDMDKPLIKIPFNAFHDERYRFTKMPDKPEINVNGSWKVAFTRQEGSKKYAIGQFQQEGNELTGTFATTTGDYGFLEGVVDGKEIWLSSFDGSHMYLFHAKAIGEDKLSGSYTYGKRKDKIRMWTAVRDSTFTLTSADSITNLQDVNAAINLCLLSSHGDSVCLDDPEFQGKAKILQIMGTWCFNCRDETKFIQEYLKKHPSPDLQIIGLAIEKYDGQRAADLVNYFKHKYSVDYPVLMAGTLKNPTENLPFIDKISAYPTMIFLDKNNVIQGTHTGFYGPATEEYETYKKEFHHRIQELVKK